MPDRLQRSPWDLVRRTMGGADSVRQKAVHLGEALRGYGSERRVRPRMQRLADLGYIERAPSRLQRMVGAVDMLRFWIVPCAADYYRSKGINFGFHTLLRFLDDPASVIDPTGFNSSRDAIIGHLLQVVHANPDYDLQLLESFEGGLDELERQTEAVLDGTHPRAESLRATVEDDDYHTRLIEHVRAYRRGERTPLLRDNVSANPRFRELERIFGTLPAAMSYFATLPDTPVGAVAHIVRGEPPQPTA